MFSLCQALPGPGSTKMIYAINVIHGGFVAGILSFFIWRYSTLHYVSVLRVVSPLDIVMQFHSIGIGGCDSTQGSVVATPEIQLGHNPAKRRLSVRHGH